MDNAKLMSSLPPYNKKENSAIELFLQITQDEIYDSEDEVILNFIQRINKEYVTEPFVKKCTATYLDFLKVKVVQKISDECAGKSEEIIAENADIAAKIVSELDNPMYVLASRFNDSPVMAEAMVFFEKHDINYKEIYDSVMTKYALDLFHEIRPNIVEDTGTPAKEIPSENTPGNNEGYDKIDDDSIPLLDVKDKIVSEINRNLPIIFTLFHDKVGAGAEDILNDDKKLTNVIGEIHKMLPLPERSVIKKEYLINYCLENRLKLISTEIPHNTRIISRDSRYNLNQKSSTSTNKKTPSVLFVNNILQTLKNDSYTLSKNCKKLWEKVNVSKAVSKIKKIPIINKNPTVTKAIFGVAGLLILGAIVFSWGEKDFEQTVSESISTQISRQEESKALINTPTLSNSVVTKPVNLSVSNSVMAKELDSNNSPQFISDTFSNMVQPLYYHFSYKGKLDISQLEVRLLQNDIEHFSHTQPDIKYSGEKAWMVINEKLSPGVWLLKLYADGSVIDFTQFAILRHNTKLRLDNESKEHASSHQPQNNLLEKESSVSQTDDLQQDNLKDGSNFQGEQVKETGDRVGEQYAANNDRSESSIKVNESKSGRIFVWPSPADSRIRILNIKPKYEHGIKLPSGKYHIEVSATGYHTSQQWISLGAEEIKKININLEPKKNKINLEPNETEMSNTDQSDEDLNNQSTIFTSSDE